jgi:hypothetical protein
MRGFLIERSSYAVGVSVGVAAGVAAISGVAVTSVTGAISRFVSGVVLVSDMIKNNLIV